jgi:hypothetical protein
MSSLLQLADAQPYWNWKGDKTLRRNLSWFEFSSSAAVGKAIRPLTRRDILKLGTGASLFLTQLRAQNVVNGQETVRDRLWMYGQEPGQQTGQYNLPGKSSMTEAEAAFYMSIPNLLFGNFAKGTDTLSQFRQLAIPCRPFKRVVWSIVDSGSTDYHKRDLVLQLASETPNITGVIMDDFFARGFGQPGYLETPKDKIGVLSVEELQELQRRLKTGKKVDLWVVIYDHDLDRQVQDHLRLCDVVTLWTWRAADLRQLPSTLAKLEKLAPKARKMLGCFMYDFGDKKPMPISEMKFQCELALDWIRQGRIAGMILDESSICDLGLDAVEWTREWIRQVGDHKLTAKS